MEVVLFIFSLRSFELVDGLKSAKVLGIVVGSLTQVFRLLIKPIRALLRFLNYLYR
jgi:hypothetical protein